MADIDYAEVVGLSSEPSYVPSWYNEDLGSELCHSQVCTMHWSSRPAPPGNLSASCPLFLAGMRSLFASRTSLQGLKQTCLP